MAERKLTPKQEAAIHEFMKNGGNKSAAYRHAYNAENMKEDTIKVKACNLFKQDNIRTTLEALQEKVRKNSIADIQEIKEFWTKTLRDDAQDMKDRTKTSELLGKTMGAFIDRTEIKTQLEVNYYAPEKNKDN
jgi:phage terminase small subunit